MPAEVEAILTQHPGVREAAVIGLKDDDLGRRVHALIEPANADAPPCAAGAGRAFVTVLANCVSEQLQGKQWVRVHNAGP